MPLGVDGEDGPPILQQHGSDVAQILARLAVYHDLPHRIGG
jgi:hypothetical protein